ncbi:hypothetical protein BTO30_11735 [Domibacillus antri]|uniref:DUF1648 domain-containing protein n=2 Tax=Domibacillus antri TaxID=1714264 RepID=A0A1Q8Q3U7_9BACI|nr:hypothetical protein BTO30_11735 [Domibacillus antri]
MYLAVQYVSLPERVPTHFNAFNVPDGWGPKWMMLIPLVIGFAIWIGLHVLEKFPHIHNYLWLTEENARRQYKNSQLLLNSMKNIILVFFSFMTIETVRISFGKPSLLGVWEMPIFLFVLFGTMGCFLFRSYRLR